MRYLLGVLGGLAICTSVMAGDGIVRQDPVTGVRLLDFCISVKFDASQSQLDAIEARFQFGSDVLYDMTDGQYAFGRIQLINNDVAGGWESEVWVHEGCGRANAIPNAYGAIVGEHINLFYESNFVARKGEADDAYTIAHEFGHQVWGLGDEYTDGVTAGGPTNAECEAPPKAIDSRYSIMDNFKSAGGNVFCNDANCFGDLCTNDLVCTASLCLNTNVDELCVAHNHDPDQDNGQSRRNKINPDGLSPTDPAFALLPGESCWDTLAGHPLRPATPPASGQLPDDAPPPDAPVVEFFNKRGESLERAFVVCVDRSGSMADMAFANTNSTSLDYADFANNLFVQTQPDGTWLGVVSFNQAPTVEAQLTPLAPGNRAAVQFALSDTLPDGQTAIGDAVLASAAEILGRNPTDNCSRAILLITDGKNNVGPDILSPDVLDTLLDARIALFAIGLGYDPDAGPNETDPDLAQLSFAARVTGGAFFAATTPEELSASVTEIFLNYSGGLINGAAGGNIADGAVQTTPVFMDPTAGEARVVLNWQNPFDQLELRLRLPDGRVIRRGDAGLPGVKLIETPISFGFIVTDPFFVPGNWLVDVIATDLAGADADYTFRSGVDVSDASLSISTDVPNALPEEPVIVRASPQFEGFGLVGQGVNLAATVTGPGIRGGGARGPGGVGTVDLDLNDRGFGADLQAGDGVYTGVFIPPVEGVYEVEAIVQVSPGTGVAPGEGLFADAPPVQRSASPFIRVIRDRFVVGLGAIARVDDNGPRGDGTSWASAMTDLQDALDKARLGPGFIRQIRVAQGRYRPNRNTTDRSRSFEFVDAVDILGGYPGFDTPSPDDRSTATGETILTGDLGGDDLPGFVNRGDNAYHVVRASGIGIGTRFDRLVIEGGNADVAGNDSSGAGVFLNGPFAGRFVDCTFRDNSATFAGGAVVASNGALPSFIGCDFLGNRSLSNAGGAVRMTTSGRPLIERCRFVGNAAGSGGGGAISTVSTSPDILGCLFVGNSTTTLGGAISLGSSVGGPMRITNSTFVANAAGQTTSSRGGALFSGFNGEAVFSNSIAWGNSAGGGTLEEQQIDGFNPVALTASIIQGFPSFGGTGTNGRNPLFVDELGPDAQPGTGDEDLRALPGSPAIDTGDPGVATALVDLDGIDRVVDGDGDGTAVVDRGAFEFVPSDCLADVNNDGMLSGADFNAWLTAFVAGSVAADQNGDGNLTGADFNAFLTNFLAGCP